jgi:sugar transferase (PEP-CTERM/EpsH1 system associated)
MNDPSKPKHILYVVHSLGVGGTERVVCDLTRAFNDTEFRTSVCCLDELGELGKELRQEGIPVHVLNRKPGVDLSLVARLRHIYLHERVDLVHAHQYTPYFYAATAALGARSVPVIFTEHGRHWPDRLRLKRAAFNQILRMTTYTYTAVSEFSRQSLIRYEKMPASAIQVIYNGIELNRTNGINDQQSLRTGVGLVDETLLVVSVGRIDPIKDFETLIQAFAYVVKKLPQASLWIAGDGDSTQKRQLIHLIERLSLPGKVKLLGTRRDVDRLLRACDLFVLSSISEASSMTILEAMAAGRAVVATRTGGNPELVVDEKTGILVPVGDVSAMSEAMGLLLRDAARRERMGEAGRARVKENFSKELSFARYQDLYQSVSVKKRRSPRKWMVKSPSASYT